MRERSPGKRIVKNHKRPLTVKQASNFNPLKRSLNMFIDSFIPKFGEETASSLGIIFRWIGIGLAYKILFSGQLENPLFLLIKSFIEKHLQ